MDLSPARADWLLAGVVTVLVATEVLPQEGHLVAELLLVPVFLSVRWRRTWPLPVVVSVAAASLGLSLVADELRYGPQLPAVAVLVAVYSAAAWSTGRTALVAAVTSLPLFVAATVVTEEGDLGDFFPYLVWGSAWFFGRLVRRRTLEAARAAGDAARAEAERDTAVREAAGAERDRIARELHDVVAHSVSLMVVQAGAERLALGRGEPQVARTTAALEAVELAGRQALTELRSMLGVLRATDEADLGPQPSLADLPDLLDRVRAAGLQVEADLPVGQPVELPAGLQLSSYRVVQESLTNALRHGGTGPTRVTVSVGDGVDVQVRSPLPATPGGSIGAGRGLVGVRERVALHGGSVTAGPVDGAWVVHAVLPCGVRA